MRNKNPPSKSVFNLRPEDLPLAIKDGVREVRFNLRRNVKKLAASVESATHRIERTPEHPSLSFLTDSLELAVRTTATVLRNVDRAAVQLLASDGPYRTAAVPLRSSASYFYADSRIEELCSFTQDHFWRYKYWLKLNGMTDVFVHEMAIEKVGQQLIADSASRSIDKLSIRAEHFNRLVEVVFALRAASILTLARGADENEPRDITSLATQAALTTVLAAEIYPTLEQSIELKTSVALVIADEIVVAGVPVWERHLVSADPAAGLAVWLEFVLRNL